MLARDLVDRFLKLKAARNVSPHTLRAYSRDLEEFCAALESEGIEDPGQVTTKILRHFISQLSERDLSSSTKLRYRSAVSSFYEYLLEDPKSLVDTNPAKGLLRARRARPIPTWIDEEDVSALLQAPDRQTPAGRRDKALLELMYSAGTRAEETVALDKRDLPLSAEGVLPQDGCCFRVRGPGVKDRRVKARMERLAVLGPPACQALKEYLADPERPLPHPKHRNDPEPVFLNLRGGRLTTRSLGRIVESHALSACPHLRITPHTLRHSFATHMLNKGATVSEVQSMLGHKNLATTEIYTQVSDRRVKETFDMSYPRA